MQMCIPFVKVGADVIPYFHMLIPLIFLTPHNFQLWLAGFLDSREEKVLVTKTQVNKQNGCRKETEEVQWVHQRQACLGHEVRQVLLGLQADLEDPEEQEE